VDSFWKKKNEASELGRILSKAIPESDNDRANYVTLLRGGVNFCHPRRANIIPDAYASRLLRAFPGNN
jgi:hypothetical protein